MYRLVIGDGGESRDEFDWGNHGRDQIEEKCQDWAAAGDWSDGEFKPATVTVFWYLNDEFGAQVDSGKVVVRLT